VRFEFLSLVSSEVSTRINRIMISISNPIGYQSARVSSIRFSVPGRLEYSQLHQRFAHRGRGKDLPVVAIAGLTGGIAGAFLY